MRIKHTVVLLALAFLGVGCSGFLKSNRHIRQLADSPEGYPRYDKSYVIDLADVLNREEENKAEKLLSDTDRETRVVIVVVTIQSIKDYPGMSNVSIETFATGLFNEWGIGRMPENKGILFLVAIKDRKVRIELGASYGHRRDDDAQRIVDEVIIPKFKQQDFAGGIDAGLRALVRTFARREPPRSKMPPNR